MQGPAIFFTSVYDPGADDGAAEIRVSVRVRARVRPHTRAPNPAPGRVPVFTRQRSMRWGAHVGFLIVARGRFEC